MVHIGSASTQRVFWLFAFTASVVCVGARAQTPIADWHVNETSWNGSTNEVIDSSASGAHGTARNGASAVDYSGRFANTAGCSSTSSPPCQHVDFGNRDLNLGAGAVVTVMAWVRWSASPQQGSPWANMLSNQSNTQMDVGQFWLQHSGNSTSTRNEFFEWAVQARTGGGGGGRVYVFSQTRPAAGVWYHVAGVYDGSTGNRVIRLYVNGVLEGTTPLRNSIVANTAAFRLQMGQWAFNQGGSVGNRAFNGDIDEGRIFQAALTQAQIQAQMRIFGTRRPRALDDTVVIEGESSDNVVDVLSNDSSEPPPGTTVAVLSVGAAANGTVTLAGGVVRYTPAPGFSGVDAFSYTMIDSLGATASANVQVDVTDNTPPNTSIVSGPPALDRSPTAYFDFGATEPSTFECSVDGAAFSTCADPASVAGLVDGQHTLAVRAIDAYGNVDATPATYTWMVDASPPSVVAFDYAAPPHPFSEAAFTTFITGGMTVFVDLTASEALSSAALRLTSGANTLTFDGAVLGSSATVEALLDSSPAPGSYAASAVLTDLAGNQAVVPLSLPAPGFNAADPVPSPCLMVDTSGAARCSDFDGDGKAGASAACPGGAGDCDDNNPTVRAFAPEIPGDGVENGCYGGADWPVDESTGVFVSPAGTPTGAGTRASPLSSIQSALALAGATDRAVFLAQGSYDDEGAALDLAVPVFGSFDSTWQRVPLAVSSAVRLSQPATLSGDIVVGLEIDLGSAGRLDVLPDWGGTDIVDSRIVGNGTVSSIDTLVLIRTSLEEPLLVVADGVLIALRSDVGAFAMTNAAVAFRRSTLAGPASVDGTFTAARSFISGPITAVGAVFRVGGSTFRAGGGPAVISASGGVVMIANSIFEGAATGIAHDAQTIVAIRNNLFDVGCAVSNAGTCAPPTCGSNGNICAPAQFTAPGSPQLGAASPAVDAGIGFEDAVVATTNVVDLDGQCVSGAPDIGADER